MNELSGLFKIDAVKHFLLEIGGKNCLDMWLMCCGSDFDVKEFQEDEHFEEFLHICNSRKMFNLLHGFGLSSYTSKELTSTSYLGYFWELKPKRLIELVVKRQQDKVKNLITTRTAQRERAFFECKNCCHEIFGFETAMDMQFRCNKCGGKLEEFTLVEEAINERIFELNTEIKKIKWFVVI